MKILKLQPIFVSIFSLIMLIQLSCSDETGLDSTKNYEFAIYEAKNSIQYNHNVDFGDINIDTIDLHDTPFLTNREIESYDTVNHIINLKGSKFNFDYSRTGVSGQLFVVVVNDEPIYCGFFWSIVSSIPCNWIYIEATNELNGLSDNQIQISAGYPNTSHFQGEDPRNDTRIFSFFSQNGKLTGNSLESGSGLNFFIVIKSEYDTTGLQLDTPINALDLESEPFIAYDEIIHYDTLNNILTLSINHDIIQNRIDGYGKQFVASLDAERQYSGLLIPIISSMIFPTITIIQPYYELDSLQANQVRISLGYPNENYFVGADLRLNENIVKRLKQDDKLK